MKTSNLVRTLTLVASFLPQLSTLCFHSRGAAGDVDLSFDPGSGINGYVNTIVAQADGKMVIGGLFTTVKGLVRTNLARLNADGSGDATFNPPGSFSAVYALAVQPDGKVLVGGQFLEECDDDWGCSYPFAVIRLNVNGTLDSSFNPAVIGIVRSVVVQSDGKVLIGGEFTTVNGVPRPRVARLYGDSVALSLRITLSNTFVIVSWPVMSLNFQLQESTNLSLPNSWSPAAQPAVMNAGQISVTVPTTVGRKLFRLKSQ